MKKKSFILLILVFSFLAVSACAATSAGSGSVSVPGNSALYSVYDFKFEIFEGGIRYGVCPVYTAPSASAFRAADGKASVDTGDRVDVAGFDKGWLLVRYATKTGYRVGYIPPQYVEGFKTNMELHFGYIPQTAVDPIVLTDDPMGGAPIALLQPGEQYYILAQYTYHGNWWYIECEVNGQTARGFIDRKNTRVDPGDGNYTTDLGNPPYAPNGNTVIGEVVVTTDNSMIRADAGTDYAMVGRAHLSDVYPVYGSKVASNGRTWYYIYKSVDSIWGWISEGVCSLVQ